MSESIRPERIAARLTLDDGEVLEITTAGVWKGDNPLLVQIYSGEFRQSNHMIAFAYGGGAGLAEVAAHEWGGTVEVFITRGKLPPGQFY